MKAILDKTYMSQVANPQQKQFGPSTFTKLDTSWI
jgi:hypothetical protein